MNSFLVKLTEVGCFGLIYFWKSFLYLQYKYNHSVPAPGCHSVLAASSMGIVWLSAICNSVAWVEVVCIAEAVICHMKCLPNALIATGLIWPAIVLPLKRQCDVRVSYFGYTVQCFVCSFLVSDDYVFCV